MAFHSDKTKKGWITLYNNEAEKVLEEYLEAYKPSDKLFLDTRTHFDYPSGPLEEQLD